MKVRATKPGYYGQRRREGDEFEIPDGRKPASWMEKVEEPKPELKPEPNQEKTPKDGAEDGGKEAAKSSGKDAAKAKDGK